MYSISLYKIFINGIKFAIFVLLMNLGHETTSTREHSCLPQEVPLLLLPFIFRGRMVVMGHGELSTFPQIRSVGNVSGFSQQKPRRSKNMKWRKICKQFFSIFFFLTVANLGSKDIYLFIFYFYVKKS